LVVAAAMAALACGSEKPVVRVQAVFTAVHEDGSPVAGTAIYLDRRLVGHTGADGVLAAALRGPGDRELQLQASCPADHVSPRALPPLRLGALVTRGGAGQSDAQISIPCERRRRTVAIAVRAAAVGGDGELEPVADLPVLISGGSPARTNGQGVAHIIVRVAPRSRLELRLDTSGRAHTRLSPSSPVVRLEIGDSDELYVLEQRFDAGARGGAAGNEPLVPRVARLSPP
jgi:hypothetical protein